MDARHRTAHSKNLNTLSSTTRGSCILPWIKIPNLGSHDLLPHRPIKHPDRQLGRAYNTVATPGAPIETFVETPR